MCVSLPATLASPVKADNVKEVEEIDDAIRAAHAEEYEKKDDKEKEKGESHVGMSEHKDAFSHDKKEEVCRRVWLTPAEFRTVSAARIRFDLQCFVLPTSYHLNLGGIDDGQIVCPPLPAAGLWTLCDAGVSQLQEQRAPKARRGFLQGESRQAGL